MFMNAGMLAEMLESIEHLQNQLKIQTYNGKAMFINAGMLAEMLKSIEHLQN